MRMANVLDLITGESSMRFLGIVREMDEGMKGKVAEMGISRLYNSLMNKTYQNFADIPDSKGNFRNYSGYNSIKETMEGIRDLAHTSNVSLPREFGIVNKSILKLENYTRVFETGFKKRRELTILTYNNIVVAIIEATSILLASCIEFIKNPDKGEIVMLKKIDNNKSIYVINQLDRFNQGMDTGEIIIALNYVNGEKGNNLLGTLGVGVGIAVGTVLALSSLIMLLRELTFYYYYSRMQISNYLSLQSQFLEYNVKAIELDKTLEPERRRRAIANQKKVVKDLQSMADKIKVDDQLTSTQTLKELNKDNRDFKIDDKDPMSIGNSSSGYDIL